MILVSQVLCGVASLVALGNATNTKNNKFERLLGWIFCAIFISMIAVIQGVFKC